MFLNAQKTSKRIIGDARFSYLKQLIIRDDVLQQVDGLYADYPGNP